MKKLLFVIEHIQGGGAERVICELSVALEKNYDVTLVVFENRETNYIHCSNYISLEIPGSSKGLIKIFNLFRRIKELRKIKRVNGIDVSISFMSNANLVNVLSGVTCNICSIRTVLSAVRTGKIARIVEKYILSKAAKVVTLSKSVEKDLIECFGIDGQKLRTIYNPCSLDKFVQEKSIKEKTNRDGLTFITAGRLIPAKGQWHIIKAFGLLLHSYPKSKLVILGEGELRDGFTKLTKKLGIESNVEFKGFVDNPAEEYSFADVFVFSSLWEGFGNAMVEAMACGLPVISADCSGGPREIIAPNKACGENTKNVSIEEYGILIPPFSKTDIEMDDTLELSCEEECLLEAMMLFARDTGLRNDLSQKAFLRSQAFETSKIVMQWEQCISEVMTNGNGNI